jgi:GH15 family glucan-1,4-alpha-glucosidase
VASPIEQYGLIGDTHTAALIGSDGSIDWLCVPRFDSPACFASLLGTKENGFWDLAPDGEVRRMHRRYRPGSLVLETEFETATGSARMIDFMPIRRTHPRVVRIVEGVQGTVSMRTRFACRFDYGHTRPWARRDGDTLHVAAGPDALVLRSDVPMRKRDERHVAEFAVEAGERVSFVLGWHHSFEGPPPPIDPIVELAETETWWREWSRRSTYAGGWADEVERSLITLKALTYEPTGGIVAAATTSLPEFLGGVRNWDYRYCWLRDASLSLDALMAAGYVEEAVSWRDWVLRAVAGEPEDIQIMYGIRGERRLDEYELGWLRGYEHSRPVRIGNAASGQLQLDVYGEVIDALYKARRLGMAPARHARSITKRIIEWIAGNWQQPDDGLWEVRGPRRHFVHSKVMAWVVADRAVRMLEEAGEDDDGRAETLRALRDTIHEEVCREGYDAERNTFTQFYGSTQLDASLLLIPQVGFLPPDDPRVVGTVDAIQRELVRDGFVMRYIPDEDAADGLPPGEGAFLACSFWLAEDLAMLGRVAEARELFERLLGLRTDLGLYAEEYDQANGRLIGNFPQAFTHLALISTAVALSDAEAAEAAVGPDPVGSAAVRSAAVGSASATSEPTAPSR